MSILATHARRVVALAAAGAFGVTAPLVVSSLSQAAVSGHHASHRDSDGDKMPNRWELRHGLNPHRANARGDADQDGLRNLAEFRDGTDPQDADTDDDGVEDGDDDTPDGECDEADEATTDNGDDDATSDDDAQCDEDTSRAALFVVG
jgi:hypothetical protein